MTKRASAKAGSKAHSCQDSIVIHCPLPSVAGVVQSQNVKSTEAYQE